MHNYGLMNNLLTDLHIKVELTLMCYERKKMEHVNCFGRTERLNIE